MSSSSYDQVPQALDAQQVQANLSEIPDWAADMDVSLLSRTWQFKDFLQAMAFANAVARIAEEHNHHPDILVSYDTVTLALTTHDAGGLTESDFLVASKIDHLPEARGEGHDERYLAG